MHIVYLTNEFPEINKNHGGIGTFIDILSQHLVENNINVSVLGVSSAKSFETITDKGIRLINIQQSNWPFGKFIQNSIRINKALLNLSSKVQIDIIEGSELSFAFISTKIKCKRVIRMHGGHHFFAYTTGKKTAFWRSFQEKRSFKKANYLIAVSNYVGETSKRLLKFNKEYSIIYNFVNNSIFKPKSDAVKKDHTICFVGTICKKKGVKELIEAFKLTIQEIPDATLHIIGRDWIDDEYGSYTSYVKTAIPDQLSKSIHFYGAVDYHKLPEIIASMSVCVYPSHSESFGLTLVEAIAMNKTIIASDIAPFKEIIELNHSWIFINPFDAKNFSNTLIHLLKNENLATALAQEINHTVMNKFDLNKLVNQNIEFYKSIL
ncbi:glycosyltransferase family 4 protein [Urechidicola sp. KH5]